MVDYKNFAPLLISFLLMGGSFAGSLFFHGTADPQFAPCVLALLVLFLAMLWPGLRTGWDVPWTATAAALTAFLVFLLVNMLWSTVPYISIMFTISIGLIPALCLLTAMGPQPLMQARAQAGAIILVLFGVAVAASIQLFFFFKGGGTRIHEPMLNPNDLATIMNLGLVPVAAFFLASENKKQSILLFVICTVFMLAEMAAQSRSGSMAAALSMLILVPFLWKKEAFPVPKMAALAVAGVIGSLIVNHLSQGMFTQNFVNLVSDEDIASIVDRKALWAAAFDMMMANPLMGTGLATFYFYYTAHRPPQDQSDGYFAHMDPLQFGSEMGILAPVLFYGALVFVLLHTIRAMKSLPRGDTRRVEIMGPFCALLALLMTAHVTFQLYILTMGIAAGVLLAWWYMATEAALGPQRRHIAVSAKMKMPAILALVVLALIPGHWVVREGLGIYYTAKIQEARAAGQDGENYFALLRRYAPASSYTYADLKSADLTNLFWNNAAKMTPEDKRALFEKTETLIKEGISLNPGMTSFKGQLAKLYFSGEVNGVYPGGMAKAEELMIRGLEKNPLSLDLRYGLSYIYRAQGKKIEALDVLEQGLKWPRPRGQAEVNYLAAIAQQKLELGDKAGYDIMIDAARRRAKVYGLLKEDQAPAN